MSKREGWASCRCGKERPIRYPAEDTGDEEWAAYQRLANVSLCRACEMDATKVLDRCPEILSIPGGVSGCRLTWHHNRRCEPFPPLPPEVRAEVIRKSQEEGGEHEQHQ